jgi:hypothetical protein
MLDHYKIEECKKGKLKYHFSLTLLAKVQTFDNSVSELWCNGHSYIACTTFYGREFDNA